MLEIIIIHFKINNICEKLIEINNNFIFIISNNN
jgi:hypothetical protein